MQNLTGGITRVLTTVGHELSNYKDANIRAFNSFEKSAPSQPLSPANAQGKPPTSNNQLTSIKAVAPSIPLTKLAQPPQEAPAPSQGVQSPPQAAQTKSENEVGKQELQKAQNANVNEQLEEYLDPVNGAPITASEQITIGAVEELLNDISLDELSKMDVEASAIDDHINHLPVQQENGQYKITLNEKQCDDLTNDNRVRGSLKKNLTQGSKVYSGNSLEEVRNKVTIDLIQANINHIESPTHKSEMKENLELNIAMEEIKKVEKKINDLPVTVRNAPDANGNLKLVVDFEKLGKEFGVDPEIFGNFKTKKYIGNSPEKLRADAAKDLEQAMIHHVPIQQQSKLSSMVKQNLHHGAAPFNTLVQEQTGIHHFTCAKNLLKEINALKTEMKKHVDKGDAATAALIMSEIVKKQQSMVGFFVQGAGMFTGSSATNLSRLSAITHSCSQALPISNALCSLTAVGAAGVAGFVGGCINVNNLMETIGKPDEIYAFAELIQEYEDMGLVEESQIAKEVLLSLLEHVETKRIDNALRLVTNVNGATAGVLTFALPAAIVASHGTLFIGLAVAGAAFIIVNAVNKRRIEKNSKEYAQLMEEFKNDATKSGPGLMAAFYAQVKSELIKQEIERKDQTPGPRMGSPCCMIVEQLFHKKPEEFIKMVDDQIKEFENQIKEGRPEIMAILEERSQVAASLPEPAKKNFIDASEKPVTIVGSDNKGTFTIKSADPRTTEVIENYRTSGAAESRNISGKQIMEEMKVVKNVEKAEAKSIQWSQENEETHTHLQKQLQYSFHNPEKLSPAEVKKKHDHITQNTMAKTLNKVETQLISAHDKLIEKKKNDSLKSIKAKMKNENKSDSEIKAFEKSFNDKFNSIDNKFKADIGKHMENRNGLKSFKEMDTHKDQLEKILKARNAEVDAMLLQAQK